MASQSTAALEAEIHRLQHELNTLKQDQGSETITVGNYLLARLEQLGVKVRSNWLSSVQHS